MGSKYFSFRVQSFSKGGMGGGGGVRSKINFDRDAAPECISISLKWKISTIILKFRPLLTIIKCFSRHLLFAFHPSQTNSM